MKINNNNGAMMSSRRNFLSQERDEDSVVIDGLTSSRDVINSNTQKAWGSSNPARPGRNYNSNFK